MDPDELARKAGTGRFRISQGFCLASNLDATGCPRVDRQVIDDQRDLTVALDVVELVAASEVVPADVDRARRYLVALPGPAMPVRMRIILLWGRWFLERAWEMTDDFYPGGTGTAAPESSWPEAPIPSTGRIHRLTLLASSQFTVGQLPSGST
jgi:hypothetical protein